MKAVMIAAATLIAISATASAEPLNLADAQLDHVTAGQSVDSVADASAAQLGSVIGELYALTKHNLQSSRVSQEAQSLVVLTSHPY
jgi:hypothetical protein